MSYRIEYDGREGKYEIRKKHKGNLILPVVFAMFLGLPFLPGDAAAALRDWLIPGEDAVTVQAFHTMTDDLRSGAGFNEALEAFCRFVIHGQ